MADKSVIAMGICQELHLHRVVGHCHRWPLAVTPTVNEVGPFAYFSETTVVSHDLRVILALLWREL